MVREYSWERESRVDSSSTTTPPPSTVSTVRARRLGVSASKSCGGGATRRGHVTKPAASGGGGWCPAALRRNETAAAQRGCAAATARAAGTRLQHQHAVGVAQDLVRLAVVAVPDVGGGHKQGEGVLLLGVQQAALQGGVGDRVR